MKEAGIPEPVRNKSPPSENDNRRIITALKKIINIYSKYLRKKLLYYFDKYRNIITKILVNEIINDIDTNSSIPFSLSDIDPIESYNILKHFPNTNIYNNHMPKLNSSLAYSFIISYISTYIHRPCVGTFLKQINL